MSRAEKKDRELDLIFNALADSRRRKVLTRLAKGPLIVKEIGVEFAMTKPAVSKHVSILENSGLIKRTEEGRIHRCELRPQTIKKIESWLTYYRKFWSESLDEMEKYSRVLSKK